ncbi:hypothetical protein EVB32_122 [Rhizobium phage RHph_TM39]|uniref:Uncharacterized protein n=2 Tax=Cuauhnahuacvirus TaxID=3044696 RepID=A0A7S5R806_9CAUD|nr:hypothetical protein PQC16_gp122 [Rhizobium phage RHph_TM30]YP_010671273.1 hypothetical protein PQC17_gp124 [Rhizobium phage RHph_Y65]QIG71593.1 hypothetical protein EVB94_122 [Rhizobium phage RHph_TM40]QIG71956.1 hypothetical protein EVB95_122 [Rhizobium phage RHph_TM2_3B]QIG72318.1 hypothetical protein EVB96_122 [Rhizobium phage RHph_TM3_3_6]QIG77110.1 hypothetical protein EVB32_122 [Rhizobium phage RHph_TM39]QIG71229.1 hypothetical protein EVB93_122 [Rhizobium phage RHph_TM30]
MAHSVDRQEDGTIVVTWDNGRKTVRTAKFSSDSIMRTDPLGGLVKDHTDDEIFAYAQYSIKAIRRMKRSMKGLL